MPHNRSRPPQRILPTSAMPVGDLSGWTQVFAEDFLTDTAVGSWGVGASGDAPPAAYSGKFYVYPDGWNDTNGALGGASRYYPTKTASTASSAFRVYVHVENLGGVDRPLSCVLGPIPASIPSASHLYWRTSIRARVQPVSGFKLAWLLWPTSEVWPRDGEIDWPEGSINANLAGYVHRQDATVGSDQTAYEPGIAFDGAWHVYTTEWTAGQVKFYRDGTLMFTTTDRIPNTAMGWRIQTEANIGGTQATLADAGYVEIDWVVMYVPVGT